jgi:hypothetical protein
VESLLFSWPVDFFPLNATCQRNKKKGINEGEVATGPNAIRIRESLKLRLLVVPSLLNQMFGGVLIVQLAYIYSEQIVYQNLAPIRLP